MRDSEIDMATGQAKPSPAESENPAGSLGVGAAVISAVANPALEAEREARRRRLGVFLLASGALGLWAFAINVPSSKKALLLINAANALHVTAPHLPVQLSNFILDGVTAAIGIWIIIHRQGRRTGLGALVALVAFSLSVLVWAARGSQLSLVGLLVTTVSFAAPLLFGSLSGILCESSGVINIAIEGQLSAGAFLGAMIGSATHNDWYGLVGGAVAGSLIGLLLAILALRYQADQIIAGVVIVTLISGLTSFLTLRVLDVHQNTLNSPSVFPPYAVPLLDKIPILGPMFFDQNIFVYAAIILLVATQIGLTRTRWGLRVRAVGEHPKAAETVGISVIRVRYRNVILGGAVGGLGGAAFTIGSTGQFTAHMVSGLGYVALAAMIFGGWRPLPAAGAALLFGFSDSLQTSLGQLNTPIPSEFLLMLPYLATIVAVAGLIGRVRPPAADGKPYQRQ